MKLYPGLHFKKHAAMLTLLAFASSLAAPRAQAYAPANDQANFPAPKKADLPFTDHGGFIIIKDDKVICGSAAKGSLSIPKCDSPQVQRAYPLAMELASTSRPQGAVAHAHGGRTKTAGAPIAFVVAAVTCGGAGYIGASLQAQQNSILTKDATETVQAAIFSVSGTATALRPAKEIVKHAIGSRTVGLIGRIAAVSTIAGAICFASAGAGYGIYHFYFRQKSDIGPAAKQ